MYTCDYVVYVKISYTYLCMYIMKDLSFKKIVINKCNIISHLMAGVQELTSNTSSIHKNPYTHHYIPHMF